MTRVAILGAGAGGCSAAVELTSAGHTVHLWNRSERTLAPHLELGGVQVTGVLGDGFTAVDLVTTDLAAALTGADVAVVCLPALAHETLADDLATLGSSVPLVLNPGHTLGALHFASRFADSSMPSIAELSTLTYVARKDADGVVTITGRARMVRAAALGRDTSALNFALALWPSARAQPDVLATSLANINLVLHPPAAVLAAAWVEATGGNFGYYSEATSPSVASVMLALDDERRAVALAYGHVLEPLIDEMLAIGTVDEIPSSDDPVEVLRIAVATGKANAAIRAPSSLEHRYYREDFSYGIVPFLDLARVANINVPVATALLTLVDVALGGAARRDGLTLSRLGISATDPRALLSSVTNGAS
jgi:opine dehydrogenase